MPSSSSFVHLHAHTEFSMLDGAARVGELFDETVRKSMPALAMTDHGNMFGAFEFYSAAKARGVKPIIGIEAYLTPGTSRFERKRVQWGNGGRDDVSGGGAYTHATLLAETTHGMHNLFRLSSLASIEGQFYKPRMDRELLSRYSTGIIATTGCPSGEVQTLLRLGKYDDARQSAADFRDIFGADNYFLELMDHGLDIEARVRDDLLRLARELALPLLATNDLHYTRPEDAVGHEALLCVQSGSTIHDANRFRLEGDGYYLKSPDEMRTIWRDLPEACDNTLLIAERCSVEFAEGRNLMPRFPVPDGETEETLFIKQVHEGLDRRYPNGVSAQARERADHETTIILQMGFPGYFLVTADLIGWAKSQGIRVGPGRGSATGAMVAYAMGITELDPLEHGLLFERFLNPERVSMPDIDIDFDERRRGEVMRYVTQRYGEDRVAQVVTYGTIKAKQALKDASRVLGYPFAMGERITKAMPPSVMGKDIPLTAVFDKTHRRHGEAGELRALYESDPDAKKIVDTAGQLENLKRQWGVHACAVILSREPLLEVIPLMKREQDGAIITQFDYPTCEALGLLKMDFLGLRNLTVVDDCLANIARNRHERVEVESLTFDDPATYQLLGRGDTLGVFQLDGGPMRSLLRGMKPDVFDDITAVLALYRPGPMATNAHNDYADRKNRRQQVVPIHPELAEPLNEVLGETHGLVVYQEQVMAIAQRVAGYSLASADLLRRAMGKKKKAELEQQYEAFSSGMAERGFSPGAVKALWDTLLPFCDYGFNKSHGAGYAVVSYWTAYLKANYPSEYMAALLTSVRDDKDKSAIYLNECRRMGIKVLPPDVNESAADFTPVGTDIRFGLSAIRNVGNHVVDGLVGARESQGRFTDFGDFMTKVPVAVCNKRVLESLCKAGAFDSLGYSRRGLVAIHEDAADQYLDLKRNEAIGQDSLFGGIDDDSFQTVAVQVPTIPEWDKRSLLAYERDMLGLYVSDHPLNGLEHVLATASDLTIGQLVTDEDRPEGTVVTVAGLVTSVVRKTTKKGDVYAVVSLEDLEGTVNVMVFPRDYQAASALLVEDAVVLVKGRAKRGRDEAVELTALEVSAPALNRSVNEGPVVISMPTVRVTPPVVEQLKDVLSTHPGVAEVHLKLQSAGRTMVMKLDEHLRVNPSAALMADLKALLGPTCLSV
ncbi:MAG TPA: DNA polymerase III subunit alpha [Nocardioidaceae bacterium]|nr:DNA polymerase III subunit alpha [Nocardioidaceae bacterium]